GRERPASSTRVTTSATVAPAASGTVPSRRGHARSRGVPWATTASATPPAPAAAPTVAAAARPVPPPEPPRAAAASASDPTAAPAPATSHRNWGRSHAARSTGELVTQAIVAGATTRGPAVRSTRQASPAPATEIARPAHHWAP